MSYTVPALKGQMGSTEYFQATVPARELAAVAKLAVELPQWTTWSVFERFQRELATKRVEKEIVPYLAQARDRFFNALIVLVYEPRTFTFETVGSNVSGLPGTYRKVADKMGFLTVDGGDLVVLDGQHRLSALRAVTTNDGSIKGEYADAVAEDELCVIFIPHESFEKTRRIFNKVNRYAKPTSPSDNIITSEDDGSAIITRWLVEPTPPEGAGDRLPPLSALDPYDEPIVEWRRTTLKPNDTKFTTLSAVYQMTQVILDANGMHGFTEKHMVNRPSDDQLLKAYRITSEWWYVLLDKIRPFRDSMQDPALLPDYRAYQSRHSLLFRPVGQIMLMHALTEATSRGLSLADATGLVSRKNWSASNPLFTGTIVYANGHMSTNETAIRLAGRLGTYHIAPGILTEREIDSLTHDLAVAKGQPGFRLPRPR
ncbi:DNA sulfur modification protein DndB [Rhodococcus kronopolitis]|uniref:DNA sulfur modification protein DndB n=1 Tax=Rhodococcus kronopolitis TaxID=1460226 RepID=A0ABV9FY30_9NOCA